EGTGPVLLDELACTGDEESLAQCSHQGLGIHDCSHKEDAGVICADMTLRLVDGDGPCLGRLELFHNGSWGTVCDDGFDLRDAAVACRQLGCGDAISIHDSALFGEGAGPVLLDELACTGDEELLAQCSHQGLGIHNCRHKEDAGVICAGAPK
ncbi:DMBT1 protein, partial [Crypturellus undulatus]|nr:DMBT1 protein [Crypturellus undulatus]